MLLHLLHPNRGRNSRSIGNQRLAGEQAGRVRIRSHASLDYIEYRQLSGRQIHASTDIFLVVPGGFRGR